MYSHRRVVDRILSGAVLQRDAAFDARGHVVLDADVGEGAAHHDFVVAAAGAVAVELRDAPGVRAGTCRPGVPALNEPAGRDVVGGDRVAEQGEHAGLDDVGDRRRHRQPSK
jgi:hypothetical protein